MKPDHLSECGGCGCQERWFLHNVRHRAAYRRLCTNCVLKNHHGLFCPLCLDVFDDHPPPPHARLMCLKCPSISHLSCATNHLPSSHCPPCSNPNFSFFNPTPSSNSNKRLKPNDNTNRQDSDVTRAIDQDSAKSLVAAAKIAAASMSKAASVARVEAERRVKEAALARKRAREALERVAYLASKEKDKDRDTKEAVRGLVSLAEQKMKSKVDNANTVSEHNNRIQSQLKTDGVVKDVVLGRVSVEGTDKQSRSLQGEKGSNGLHSVSPVAAGQSQRQQSGRSRDD